MTLFGLQQRIDAFEEKHGAVPKAIYLNEASLEKLQRAVGIESGKCNKFAFGAIPIKVDNTVKSVRLEA